MGQGGGLQSVRIKIRYNGLVVPVICRNFPFSGLDLLNVASNIAASRTLSCPSGFCKVAGAVLPKERSPPKTSQTYNNIVGKSWAKERVCAQPISMSRLKK